MRKYLVPLLLFSAIGVVIVVLVKFQGDDGPRELPENKEVSKEQPAPTEDATKTLLQGGGRETPTKLSRNRWLSELERVLERDDLKNAHHFKAKLMEQMTALLEDDVLVRNLTSAIRKYAIEERDPEKRKLLLPILRLLTTEEATQIIEEEYYRTTDEEERLILLSAMVNPKHNPDTAGLWAADMALNSADKEMRYTSFLYVQDLPNSYHEIVVRTAKQIYEASTRPEQRIEIIDAVARRAELSETGRAFLRERMKSPHASEIGNVINYIESWGNLRDAIVLESLAAQFPAMQDLLRQRAEKIRMMARLEDDPGAAKAMLAEEERAALEREKRKNEKE